MSNLTNTLINTLHQEELARINSLELPQEEKDLMIAALNTNIEGKITLTNQQQVINLLSFMKKDQIMLGALIIDGKKREFVLQRTSVGRLFREATKEEVYQSRGKVDVCYKDIVTKDYIIVTLDNEEKEMLTQVSVFNENNNANYGIKIKHDGAYSVVLLPRVNDENNAVYYVNWKTKKIVKANKQYCNYMMISSSPSQDRNNQYVGVNTDTVDIEATLNSTTNNAWNEMKKLFENLDTNEVYNLTKDGTIGKSLSRLGQVNSASINMGKLNNWLYFKQPFTTKDDIVIDGKLEKRNKQTIDGTAYKSASAFAIRLSKVFTKYFNVEIEVTEESVIGLFIQFRPGLMKGACLVVDDNFMLSLTNNIKKNYNKDDYRLHSTDNKDAIHKDNFIPNLIVDKNIIKADFDFDDADFEYLAFGKYSAATTSEQMLTKICEIAFLDRNTMPKVSKMFKELTNITLDNWASEYLDEKILTTKDLKNDYNTNVLRALDPTIVNWNSALRSSTLRNMEKKAINILNKTKLDTRFSFNARLISDPMQILGYDNVLKFGELYNAKIGKLIDRVKKAVLTKAQNDNIKKKQLNDYIQERLSEYDSSSIESLVKYDADTNEWYVVVIMFKYPSIGAREYYKARFVSKTTIKKRCLDMGATKEFKSITNLSDGVVCVPASSDLMAILAGMDFDFDGGSFFVDNCITNVFEDINTYYKTEIEH